MESHPDGPSKQSVDVGAWAGGLKASGPIPNHIAIIMDGNGRWARRRGLPRSAGHRAGVQAVRPVVEAAGRAGVKFLTLYGFSTENWKRPRPEVDELMSLLVEFARKELQYLLENDVKVRVIGRIEELPGDARGEVERIVRLTRDNSALDLVLALNYGGRRELVEAARRLAAAAAAGELAPDDIDEELLAARLHTGGLPDPDLVIRTGGEIRVSNFLLWQSAYAEYWFTPVCWPDFGRDELGLAIEEYQRRERRFGTVTPPGAADGDF